MDKFQSSRQKRMSQRQEKLAAEAVGGQTTAGSGAAKSSGGGDVRVAGEMRIECKYTEKDYFVLELAVLHKIKMEALRGGLELPVLQLTFVAKHTGVQASFAIIPKHYFWEDGSFEELCATKRKRIRLHKTELQASCLRKGVARITFTKPEGYEGDSSYDIAFWHTFLADRQEEEEC